MDVALKPETNKNRAYARKNNKKIWTNKKKGLPLQRKKRQGALILSRHPHSKELMRASLFIH